MSAFLHLFGRCGLAVMAGLPAACWMSYATTGDAESGRPEGPESLPPRDDDAAFSWDEADADRPPADHVVSDVDGEPPADATDDSQDRLDGAESDAVGDDIHDESDGVESDAGGDDAVGCVPLPFWPLPASYRWTGRPCSPACGAPNEFPDSPWPPYGSEYEHEGYVYFVIRTRECFECIYEDTSGGSAASVDWATSAVLNWQLPDWVLADPESFGIVPTTTTECGGYHLACVTGVTSLEACDGAMVLRYGLTLACWGEDDITLQSLQPPEPMLVVPAWPAAYSVIEEPPWIYDEWDPTCALD